MNAIDFGRALGDGLSTKKVFVGLGASVALIVGVIVFKLRTTPQDPSEISQRYMMALVKGDADEIWRLTDHHEFETNSMTKADLDRFLKEWLQPRVVNVEGTSYDTFGTGSSGFQTYSWGLATRLGRLSFGVSVAKTDDGLKVVQPLTSIFSTFSGLKPGGIPAHGPEEVTKCYWQNGLKLSAELAPYHFTKLQLSPNLEPISISAFALHNRDKYYQLLNSK